MLILAEMLAAAGATTAVFGVIGYIRWWHKERHIEHIRKLRERIA